MKKTILLFALTVCTVVASHSQTTDYFPLSTFDKTIWDPNKFASFDATTGVFIADQYGFGGWGSSTPLDLSAYKYLVMNFETDPSSTAAALRVFDANNYWGTPAEATFVTTTQAVIDLQNVHKMSGTTDNGALNPATIYIVGVWTYGWDGTAVNTNAVTIKDCYVTNNDDYSNSNSTTGISIPTIKENKLVDVYTITGSRIRSQVLAKDATKGLDKGLYLVGNKKVLVTDAR